MEQRVSAWSEELQFNWGLPPANWNALRQHEVHCWVACLTQPAGMLKDLGLLLSLDELERAARFRIGTVRDRFVAARGLLRQILSRYTGILPRELIFVYGPQGKPSLAPWLGNNIQFNLSHAGALALFAVSSTAAVGIDIEQLLPIGDAADIAKRFFTAREYHRIESASRGADELFYHCWTRKEAVLKCSGEGIGDQLSVRVESFDGSICELRPADGYIGALAVDGTIGRLKTWQWSDDFFSPSV